jgi:enoyl-CoA hydratase/carnithine racemase
MNVNDPAVRRLKQVQGQLAHEEEQDAQRTPFPKLPAGARYLFLDNEKRRNALSFAVLQDLRDQLYSCNRSPVDGQVRLLPPFNPEILGELEIALQRTTSEAAKEYGWLVDSNQWNQHRSGLPRVIVLRSAGPVFCSGHDLNEVRNMGYKEVKKLFTLCAEVMCLIRRCPVPVIGVVQGLATAAGAQLALTTDLPVSHASTQVCLPGSAMGLPCISPSTAISRKVGNAFAYQMFALTERHSADELPGGPIRVLSDNISLDDAVVDLIKYYTQRTAGQPQALGKWAYWTQTGLNGKNSAADGYEDAVEWTGKVMALFAQTNDAKEGIEAFLEKRKPCWHT